MTAKCLSHPNEARKILIAFITSDELIFSSPMGASTNSCFFNAGMAPTLSDVYTANDDFIESTSLQFTVIIDRKAVTGLF